MNKKTGWTLALLGGIALAGSLVSCGGGKTVSLATGDAIFTRTPYVDLSALPAKIQFKVDVSGDITNVLIGRISVPANQYVYQDGIMTIDATVLKDSAGKLLVSSGEADIKIMATKTVTVPCLMVAKVLKTAADLAGINQDTSSLQSAYILGNDIDCSSITNWEPLGYGDSDDGTHYEQQFNGILDGNGYTIKNVTTHYNSDPSTNQDIYEGNYTFDDISHRSGDKFGFFQEIGKGGIVRNLAFSNVSITGRTICGVVAGLNSGTIENVLVDDKCSVKMSTHFYDESCDIGGIAGIVGADASVVNCVAATSNLAIVATYTDYDATNYQDSDKSDHHIFYSGEKGWEDSNGKKANGIYAGVGLTYGTSSNSLGLKFNCVPTGLASDFSETHIEANKSKDGPDAGLIDNCAVYSLADLKKAATYDSYGFDSTIWNIKDGALPSFKAAYPYLIR